MNCAFQYYGGAERGKVTVKDGHYLKYAWGVLSRGVKRLPMRLRPPAPPLQTPVLQPSHYRIAVYFADGPVNLYQMRQWYGPLTELSKMFPVVVIARHEESARIILAESNLEVSYAPLIGDVEELVAEQPLGAVFYVNNHARNFQMMRYGKPAHVLIYHGESDKAYMVSAQHKAYDYSFVAGNAAKARLSAALWGYDVDERTFSIGRPQIDHFDGEPPYPRDGRTVVLYAPTWEGDRPTMAYGSIVSHGLVIAETLLQSPRHRLVYRPHPRSGAVSGEYREANQRIIQMIRQANSMDPTARHVHDESGEISWQLSEPDLVITDISAMLYDRLAVGKPVMVTQPASPETLTEQDGYLGACDWLTEDELEGLHDAMTKATSDSDSLARLAAWSEWYFGAPGHNGSTQRFHRAVAQLLEAADARDSTHAMSQSRGKALTPSWLAER